MTDEFSEVRKATIPAEERYPHHAGNAERNTYETLFYDHLLADGWEPRNNSDCVMHDDWWHPIHGEHPALVAGPLSGFDCERALADAIRNLAW